MILYLYVKFQIFFEIYFSKNTNRDISCFIVFYFIKCLVYKNKHSKVKINTLYKKTVTCRKN